MRVCPASSAELDAESQTWCDYIFQMAAFHSSLRKKGQSAQPDMFCVCVCVYTCTNTHPRDGVCIHMHLCVSLLMSPSEVSAGLGPGGAGKQ